MILQILNYCKQSISVQIKSMNAHNIGPNTLLGFIKNNKLFYMTYDYNVNELYTDETVAYGILNTSDVSKLDKYTPIYAKDIAPGRDITIRSNVQKLTDGIGISISQITMDKDWYVSEFLCYTKAVKLMHKWFTEHKLVDIYEKQHKMSPIKAFTEWVTGPNIKFFSPSDRHIWYKRAMAIDYEMEKKSARLLTVIVKKMYLLITKEISFLGKCMKFLIYLIKNKCQ